MTNLKKGPKWPPENAARFEAASFWPRKNFNQKLLCGGTAQAWTWVKLQGESNHFIQFVR